MIRTYTLDCHAANPQMPLEPVRPFTGSAATFVLVNLPRPHGNQKIEAVSVNVTNADGAISAHPATREGSSWIVTVPASAIGPAGNVREGVIISASGVDEQKRPVPSWIVAVADLYVKNQDGTAVPGEPRVLISWFAARPANPRGIFICPNPDGQAALDLYNGQTYIPLTGGSSVSVVPPSPSAPDGAAAEAKTARNIGDTDVYKKSLGRWIASDLPEGFVLDDQPYRNDEHWSWDLVQVPQGVDEPTLLAYVDEDAESATFIGQVINVYATRQVVGYETTGDHLAKESQVEKKADEFAPWVAPAGRSMVGQPVHDGEDPGQGVWFDSNGIKYITIEMSSRDFNKATELEFFELGDFGNRFTSTRKRVLRTGDAATPQELAQVASAVQGKRDLMDNTCHKTEEFTRFTWTSDDPNCPVGWIDIANSPSAPQPYRVIVDEEFGWTVNDIGGYEHEGASEGGSDFDTSVVFAFCEPHTAHVVFRATATRSAVCTDGEKFMTPSRIFGIDGKPTDTFATDLFGKQVAINALHYALYSVPTTGADANKLKDRAVNSFTFSGGSLPTFPAQVAGYARDFLLNVTATADGSNITIPEPDGSTATSIGDALAFTANKTYLVAITEIAAKHYYIRVIDTTPANAA